MAIAAVRLNQLIETKARILDAAREAVALSGWKDAQIALIAENVLNVETMTGLSAEPLLLEEEDKTSNLNR